MHMRLLNLLANPRMSLEIVSHEIIAAAWCLYQESPHRQPYNFWYNDLRVLSQALDCWDYLAVQGLTADVTQSFPEDPLLKFTAGTTGDDCLCVFQGSRVQMQPRFSFATCTIALTLLFEGLLTDS
jgi:hypothetical protein